MIHYRHDGKPKRTLCGLRIALDGKPRSKPVYETGADGKRVKVRDSLDPAVTEQPRLLLRDTTWLPGPMSEETERTLTGQGHVVHCQQCLSVARATIEHGRAKAREPRSDPKRRWQEEKVPYGQETYYPEESGS